MTHPRRRGPYTCPHAGEHRRGVADPCVSIGRAGSDPDRSGPPASGPAALRRAAAIHPAKRYVFGADNLATFAAAYVEVFPASADFNDAQFEAVGSHLARPTPGARTRLPPARPPRMSWLATSPASRRSTSCAPPGYRFSSRRRRSRSAARPRLSGSPAGADVHAVDVDADDRVLLERRQPQRVEREREEVEE